MGIPDTLMLAVCAFGPELPGERVELAIAKGIQAGGMREPETCTITETTRGKALTAELEALGFDARMRRARAVVVGAGRLDRGMLAGSAVFELATRARQAGVPAYAVTAVNELDAFDARMLDLQVILEASTVRGLSTAGRKLAGLV
jgi:glycerate kinase